MVVGNKEKVLVTGGAGFIGSNLCEKLIQLENYDVFSLDNYSTGSTNNHVEGVNYIKGNTEDISMLIDFNPGMVFHLGEYSRVEQSFRDFEQVWQSNIKGTQSIVTFCKSRNSKLIYAGSSTKFGDGGLGRYQSPYGWTKATNTEFIKAYSSWYGLDHAIAYFYNAYGPREIKTGPYATLIAYFADRMKNNQALTVVTPGTQKRNFTYVDDIVSGLIIVGKKGSGDEYGIGHPDSFSILEVAQFFGGEIEMLPTRRGNRMDAQIVVNKTLDLGWKAKHSVAEYIESLRKNNWQQ